MIDKITVNTQSSIKIKDSKIIYFDPFKITDKLNDADIIFITHDHYDHLDIESINNVKKDDTLLVIPSSIIGKIENNLFQENKIIMVNPNEEYEILGYKVKTIPSYNINKKFHPKENKYVGYIITINNEDIYIAGDSDITEEMANVECDIALIPIGGTFTCTYEEAAEFINKIKPKYVIPIHYGSIVGSLSDGEKFQKLIEPDTKCVIKIN